MTPGPLCPFLRITTVIEAFWKKFQELPLWHSGLSTRHCDGSGTGYSSSLDLVPGLGHTCGKEKIRKKDAICFSSRSLFFVATSAAFGSSQARDEIPVPQQQLKSRHNTRSLTYCATRELLFFKKKIPAEFSTWRGETRWL